MARDFSAGLEAARQLIATLAQRYPALEIVPSERSLGEWDFVLPVLPGLKTEIWLAFSNNDEIHFGVENFWIEYFPCTDPVQREEFIDAVSGFIDGRYQINEHYRGGHCVRADLQKPNGGGWETIASWSRFHWPIPYSKTYKTITNR